MQSIIPYSLIFTLTDQNNHGGNLALPISTDCHWGLHCRKILFNKTIHGRPLRTGVRSDCWGGLFLSLGGDRTWETC